jgi:hypoxanthine phosphoribosyltransferase
MGGGGLPARLIVDALLGFGIVRAVVPCQIRRYSGVERGGATKVTLALDKRRVRGEVVIGVDDMVDGGQTLAAFRAHGLDQGASEVDTAVIYVKPGSIEAPGFFAEDGVRQWLVMPGEELDFMSELVRTDSEVRRLSASEARLYFEALGFAHDTVADWALLRRTAPPGVQ